MGAPAAGTVVLVPFPFSDLSRAKLRPALVLVDVGRDGWILCQITSNPYADTLAVALTYDDFLMGSLRTISYVRPGHLEQSISGAVPVSHAPLTPTGQI